MALIARKRPPAADPCALPRTRIPALAQLVTEAACNPAFAVWLFTSPACALDAVRRDASHALGPGLPGPEFMVPAIPLSDAECRALISLGARSLNQLARAVWEWQEHRPTRSPGPIPDLVAVGQA